MSNKKLLQAAQELLNKLEGGKEFPSKYVYDRLVVASEKHPKDIKGLFFKIFFAFNI